jgi:hypothetical protein
MKLDLNIVMAALAFIVFFAMMFGAITYSDTQRYECRKAAIEKNLSAVDTITVCR